MNKPLNLVLLLVLCLATAGTGRAQVFPRLSVGPQLSTLGIGVSADARFSPLLSISAEYSFLPRHSASYTFDGQDYDTHLDASGGMLAVNVHPFGSNFALGAGLFTGGYQASGNLVQEGDEITIGDDTYPAEQVGRLHGKGSLKSSVAPAFYVGWRGRGFNFGFGAIVPPKSSITLDASGPIRNDPTFQRSIQREEANVEDSLDELPFMPYLRLGIQFGL